MNRTIRFVADATSGDGRPRGAAAPPPGARAWRAGELRSTDAGSAAWLVARGVATAFTPDGVTVGAVTGSSVALSWSPITSAAGYRVERSSDAGATWAPVASGSGGSPTGAATTVTSLGSLASYRFRVSAVDGEGNRGDPSAPIAAVTAA